MDLVAAHGQQQEVINMPTAAGMPMPMTGEQGLASGFKMGDSLIQNLMNRQKMQQQAEQFAQELALRKQANARAAQAAADAHRKMDPMYEINQYRALENWIKGNAGQDGAQQMPLPTQEMGEGMGMFTPEGLQSAQQQQQVSAPTGGLDIELLKAHPVLRGFAKKHLGFDPLGHEVALQGAAREAMDLERLKGMLPGGAKNPVYQNALKAYNAKLHAQEDLSGIRGRTLGGLKTGERWLTDQQTGETIGKEIPLTATERTEYKGRGFFNHVFPQISGGLAPMSGEGSITRLSDAAGKYGIDPVSTKLVDDFLLSKKLLTAGTVKEAATLASGKQKATYQQLRDSLDSSDIPKTIEKIIKQFGLPPEAAMKADMRFAKMLNEATKVGEHSVPAFQQQYFDPEKQQAKLTDDKAPEDVIVIDPNGQSFTTTKENAQHLPEGWSLG